MNGHDKYYRFEIGYYTPMPDGNYTGTINPKLKRRYIAKVIGSRPHKLLVLQLISRDVWDGLYFLCDRDAAHHFRWYEEMQDMPKLFVLQVGLWNVIKNGMYEYISYTKQHWMSKEIE